MIITCRELTELSTDKKEQKLTRTQRLGVAIHLSWCHRCRRYLEQLDLTVETLKHIHDAPVSDAARADLRARFQQKRR